MTPRWLLLASAAMLSGQASAQQGPTGGLLFALSGDHGTTAEQAGGKADPIFVDHITTVASGVGGSALAMAEGGVLAWGAPGNIYAQRGTLAFSFRARTPIGTTPFPIFRVGAADSTSWDDAWLRIDWNGHGFDAFVTDTNLARVRVSFRIDHVPAADAWTHLAFAWDERSGVRLWVDGRPAARLDRAAVLDQGLFAFGPFMRVLSPYQAHSRNNFRRAGDIDEVRIYDHALNDTAVATLAARGDPVVAAEPPRSLADAATRAEWRHRLGFDGPLPPLLSDPVTRLRKVEFTGAWDEKERMFRGTDGIRETTWPGVYNRSRLPGRNDYFQLPDWNVYAVGGKSYRLTLPNEPWNRIELTGAAYGTLVRTVGDGKGPIFTRAKGTERSTTQWAGERHGGEIRFDNVAQETPIQEIAAYDVGPGTVPAGLATFSYRIGRPVDPAMYPGLDPLVARIAGRYPADERATVVALPAGAPSRPLPVATGGAAAHLPLVHVLIPANFRDLRANLIGRFSYGWQNMDAGLDGIALDLPALHLGGSDAPIPLNIRLKDPLWPDRDLIDVNVAVPAGAARTLWLDSRDRMLPAERPLYLTIAAGDAGLDAAALQGMRVRLVFKPAAAAKAEHVADRLEQARDELSFLVEEQPSGRAWPGYDRFERDITDVLRVDPGNAVARSYWVEKAPEQPYAPFVQPKPPAGVPLWAFRQVEDLKLYRRFVDWWIDHRQIADGEFGGGLSDDTDLVNQWVPLALMGVEPDRLIASQRAVVDATFANGMWSGGLSRIRADELHSYEEGINAVAQSMQIDWGNPTAIERGMAVAREYPRLIQRNPAGHLHIVSSYYSGTDIVREGIWGWQKSYSLLVTHPGLLLVNWNGAPPVRSIVLGLLDGWLAHGTRDKAGGWRFPEEIEWATDKGRGNGVASAVAPFWAGYSWTGDAKYLRPLENDLARADVAALSQLNPDVLARLPQGPALADRIAAGHGAVGGSVDRNTGGIEAEALARFIRWQQTGDTSILADLFGDEVESDSQRMNLLTEGHFWSDRVAVPSELLQRARMGGVAHRRNAYFPGNLVSWRFAAPGSAEDVALLIPHGNPRRFEVQAYNLSDHAVTATMTGAELAPGRWRVTGGSDADGDGKADAPETREVVLERGAGPQLVFAPHGASIYRFELVTPGDDPATRPDVGIGADDVTMRGRRVTVRIHGLGATPSPAGTVTIADAHGTVVAHTRFAPLAAPVDLLPKVTTVRLTLPASAIGQPLSVGLALDGAPAEITLANNRQPLPNVPGRKR